MSPTQASHNGDATDAAAAHGSDSGAQGTRDAGDDSPWGDAMERFQELREYASYYIAANVDRLRLTYRVTVLWAIVGVLIALIAASVVITASVVLVVSLADGLGELFGGRTWLGGLVVSGLILTGVTAGAWFVLSRRVRSFQRRLVNKYESRKQRERTDYGTDVAQRAQKAPRNS